MPAISSWAGNRGSASTAGFVGSEAKRSESDDVAGAGLGSMLTVCAVSWLRVLRSLF